MATLRVAKKQLRTSVRDALAQVSRESVSDQSSRVTAAVQSMPEYVSARNIGIYLSMPSGEITTQDLVQDALSRGKKVFVPLIYTAQAADSKSRKLMDMVALRSLGDFEECLNNRDSWDIPTVPRQGINERERIIGENSSEDEVTEHPSESNTSKARTHLDVILMPGMAFDRNFGRLGHGKGFYDFFLQRYHIASQTSSRQRSSMPTLIGLALEEQVLQHGETVPVDDSDWRLDALISGNGAILRA